MLRKLLICILASLLTNSPFIGIGFEECSESSPLIGTTLKNSLEVIIGIKGDHVVIREMDLKSDNIWDLLVSVKVENSPDSIQHRDVVSVNPPLDLVLLSHFKCTMIWPFWMYLNVYLKVPRVTAHSMLMWQSKSAQRKGGYGTIHWLSTITTPTHKLSHHLADYIGDSHGHP